MARQPQRQAVGRIAQLAHDGVVEHAGMQAFEPHQRIGAVELHAQHQLVRQQRLQLALGPQEKLAAGRAPAPPIRSPAAGIPARAC